MNNIVSIFVVTYFKGNNYYYHFIACMTTEGKQCLFPFKYKNKTDNTLDSPDQELTYTKCSTETIYRPWCPTSNNDISNINNTRLIYQ